MVMTNERNGAVPQQEIWNDLVGDLKAAITAFESVLEIRDDAASSAMIERCRQQLENPAGEDWDGTTVARTK